MATSKMAICSYDCFLSDGTCVATIYGLVFANIVCIPTANRIRTLNAKLALYKYMTAEGLVSICGSENTIMLKRRIAVFTGIRAD